MAAKLERTKTPGIFKRGTRYVFSYRVDGRQKWESARTLDEAKTIRSARLADIARGEFHERLGAKPAEAAGVSLHVYARKWVERYHGTGKRGFREETRAEYRQLLERYALEHFSESTALKDLSPSMIAEFIDWLVKQPNGRGGTLSDKSVRNALGPLMACLATAKREGEIPANPAAGSALPHRPRIEEDEELPRPFPRIDEVETMELVVAIVHASHRLMFELLAVTGLRRSELLALEVRHLHLSGNTPHVKVRQRTRWLKGQGQVVGPLKSRHARRDLPIPLGLARKLAAAVEGKSETSLVFASPLGRPYDPHHLHARVLVPACEEAGVEWAGFHTFRHTVATRMFAAGRNAVQVQHWLGHHSAAFTLATYVHLLDGDLGGPLEARRVLTEVQTSPTTFGDIREMAADTETVS